MNNTYDTTDLGKPLWMLVVEQAPQREKSIEERIAELQRKRELIDIEIELLRPRKQYAPQVSIPPACRASFSGFHNPFKHHGLTAEQFLERYIQRFTRKATPHQAHTLKWVLAHKQESLDYIRRSFKNTLKE